MTMTMTMTRRLTAIAFLTTFALLPACGDLGSARVDEIAYEADGSLVVFMATGIHVLAPSLYRESITIPFDDLPVNTAPLASRYSLSADGRVAAVAFPLGGAHSEKVRGWPDYGDFAQTLARWLSGDDTPPGVALRTTIEGDQLALELLYDETWNARIAQAAPQPHSVTRDQFEAPTAAP